MSDHIVHPISLADKFPGAGGRTFSHWDRLRQQLIPLVGVDAANPKMRSVAASLAAASFIQGVLERREAA